MESSLLYKLTKDSVQWGKGGYACADFPFIDKILAFRKEAQEYGRVLKFLREPEHSRFRQVLSALNIDPDDVVAFLFTDGLTDPKKTNFYFEYLGEDTRYHRYFPDSLIAKKTSKFYIIEIKDEKECNNSTVNVNKRQRGDCRKMPPDKFKYHIIYSASSLAEDVSGVFEWIQDK